MDTLKTIIFASGGILFIIGLAVTFAGQYHLLKNISRWNGMKACVGVIPFFLLLFMKFDNQVKIICRNLPNQRIYFERGLVMACLGVALFLLTGYI
jgi:hypothetical protein